MKSCKQKTILLVEDETLIAMSERLTLERFGYTVFVADSGDGAIREIRTNPGIDLVIMDIDLGAGISGPEAAEEILLLRHIPILFLTSHAEREMVEKVRGITRYGYVIKNTGNFVLQSSIEMAFELFEANEKTRKSELKLRAILDATPFPIALVDRDDSTINFWSQSAHTLFGHTAPTASEWYEIAYPDSAYRQDVVGRWKPFLEKAWSSGETVNTGEYRVSCHDGSVRVCELYAGFIDDSLVVTFNDITESRRTQIQLAERNKFIESLVNLTPGILYIYDLVSKKNIFSNDGIQKILGYTVEELHAMGDQMIPLLMHQDDLPGYLGITIPTYATAEDHEPIIHQYRMKHKSGEWRWLYSNETLYLRQPDGSPQQIFGMIHDITDSKRVEEALCETQSILQAAMDQSEAGIAIADAPDGRLRYVNDAGLLIRGGTRESVVKDIGINEYVKSWQLLDLDDRPLKPEEVPLARAILFGETCSSEFKIRRTIGDDRIVLAKAAPIINNTGQVIAAIVVFMDVTDRKQAEEEVRHLLHEKTILLKEVHHRIKNNIASVESLLSLQSDAIDNPVALSVLNDAISRVGTMRVQYDSLLITDDYTDIASKKYFEEIIDAVIDIYPNAEIISLEKRISDFSVSAKIITSLGMIVNELISNSIKYAFNGRERGILKISVSKTDATIKIVIADDGVGISSELFKDGRKGFGLMLVDMLVKQLSGSFSMSNDGGTKCVIECAVP